MRMRFQVGHYKRLFTKFVRCPVIMRMRFQVGHYKRLFQIQRVTEAELVLIIGGGWVWTDLDSSSGSCPNRLMFLQKSTILNRFGRLPRKLSKSIDFSSEIIGFEQIWTALQEAVQIHWFSFRNQRFWTDLDSSPGSCPNPLIFLLNHRFWTDLDSSSGSRPNQLIFLHKSMTLNRFGQLHHIGYFTRKINGFTEDY